MSTFTFGNPDPAFHTPNMDTNVAVRRILQILNESGALASASGSGSSGGGSTITTGNTFKTLADVIVTNAGVAQQCVGSPSPRGVLVEADVANTGPIYVGDATVTNASGSKRGLQLVAAGMSSVVIPVSTSDQIFVNADTSGDRATVTIL